MLMLEGLRILIAAGCCQIVTCGIVTPITSDQFNPIQKKIQRVRVIMITPTH